MFISEIPNLFSKRVSYRQVSSSALFARFAYPIETNDKHSLPLWAPVTFKNNDRSEGALVESVHALVLDSDGGSTIEQAQSALADYYGLIYSSFRYTPRAHKYRIILPLAQSLSADDYPPFWSAMQAVCLSKGIRPDPSCKNASRMWFVPGRKPGAEFVAVQLDGALLESYTTESLVPAPVVQAAAPRIDFADRDVRFRRARAYVAKMPHSIEGKSGDYQLFLVAVALVRGFDLSEIDAIVIMREYNRSSCQPMWPDGRLVYKLRQAETQSKLARGYLLDRRLA